MLAQVNPSEEVINAILAKMGKTRKEDELNCGTCGYPTCREKAVAVYQGKAEPSMCLPFMMEKAESFSDKIISVTPNAIMVFDEKLNVQQMNDCLLYTSAVYKRQHLRSRYAPSERSEYVSERLAQCHGRHKPVHLHKPS